VIKIKRTKCPKCGTIITCKNKENISNALSKHKKICGEIKRKHGQR